MKCGPLLVHRASRAWFGHMEKIDEHRMARSLLMAEVSGGLVRGRPRLAGWCEGGLGKERNDGGGFAIMRER